MLHKLLLAVLLAPALAGAADRTARLETLQVEIWPEYDRPAVLVILKGELAADVKLPATLSLRIPASSGGPGAVAYSAQKTGPLLNLAHERSSAAGFITLRFTVPERFFHVEFYDPLATAAGERTYKYVWQGDLPVGALHVALQEPAAARDLSVQPEMGQSSVGSDGLRYRAAALGPVEAGASRAIEIRYSKSDPRTSVEILKTDAPLAGPPALASSEEQDAFRLFLASGAFALLVAGSSLVYFLWWRRRPRAGAGEKTGANFCAKCGNALAAGDRFCPKCGTARA